MQKRLLALVATVAMVLSMFAGVAFAADPAIALSTTKVISSYPHLEYQPVSGAITGVGEGTYTVDVYTLVEDEEEPGVYNEAYIYEDLAVNNGTFSFFLPTNLLPQDVYVDVYNGSTFVVGEEIEVRYNVSTTPDKLEFPFTGVQKPEAITGTVTNSKGEGVEGVTVKLTGPGKTDGSTADYFGTAGVTTNSKGEFGYVVLEWLAQGSLSLTLEGIEHKTGKVTPKGATLTVTPNTGVVHSLGDAILEVKGSGFSTGTVTYTLKKGNTTIDSGDYSITTGTIADGKFTASLEWEPTSAGTYTLTATQGNYVASATISVVNPVSYNFINGSKLEELKVGSNQFTFNETDIHVIQYTTSGPSGKTFTYKVFVDGKEQTLTAGVVDITAAKLGTKTIKVEAYDGDAKVFEKTITAKVVGWDIAVDPTNLTVNQAQNVVVVIKDENGAAINNAHVTLDGQSDLLPGAANIQNGTYTFKDVKYAQPGTKWVKVYKDTDLMAEVKVTVVGQQVYNVTADVEALLQGKGQDVNFTVTRDGVAVMAQKIEWIYADGKNTDADVAYPSYVGNGVNKANIKATKAGALTVRASNFDGTLMGETTINVVAPQLVLIDENAANVTENFKSTVNFKVVDPRDGSAITSNLAISGLHAEIEVWDANGGVVVLDAEDVANILGDEEYTLTILATDADYKAAEKAEEVVSVEVRVNETLLDAQFEVKAATLTADPGMIVIGAQNNLTLTYEDANGNPIEGKKVTANEADLGKTDENGQVVYPAGIVAAAVKAEAETDVEEVTVELTIKIGYDTEAPKVTWEIDGTKATIVISDNVRIVRINIDGQEIDFWPGAKYEFVRNVTPGDNKIHIKAQDSSDNVFDEVVNVEFVSDSIVLQGEQVKRQGEYLYVQLRQFEELGAQIAWNQETRTARFILDETTVEVTIGSTTAVVNGESVTMPVAPFIENDRTFVPVRFISENLGWHVHWATGDIVTIIP